MGPQKQKSLSELIEWKNLFLILLSLALCFALFSGGALAQETVLSIDDVELTEGDTVTLYLTLAEAIDGLGRVDASIVSGNPEVAALKALSPEAVSKQFLQVDKESAEELKFKLVDLKKKVDPGDRNVKLLKFKVKAGNAGKAELSLTDVKYIDEDGNLIKPAVNSAEITVKSPATEKKETDTKEEKANGKDKDAGQEQKPEDEGGAVKEEVTTEKEPPAAKDYVVEMGDLQVKLGETKKAQLFISSLPDGLRVARVAVTNSGGVTFDSIEIVNPAFYEVIDHSEKLLSFRVGDFNREIQSETDNLQLAEIGVKGLKVGKTNMEVKLTIWTDKGEVVKPNKSMTLSVGVGNIGNSVAPAKDLDGDGLFEDVNGDGKVTESDAFVLAFNLETKIVRNNSDLFDFNRDGKITFDDPVKLIKSLE